MEERWNYVKSSEDDWCQQWRYTIIRAVESKTQGCINVRWVEESGERERAIEEEQQRGIEGAASGLLRGVSGVLREEGRRRGWEGTADNRLSHGPCSGVLLFMNC